MEKNKGGRPQKDPAKKRTVELMLKDGMKIKEIARIMNEPIRTIRFWAYGK